MVFLELSFR